MKLALVGTLGVLLITAAGCGGNGEFTQDDLDQARAEGEQAGERVGRRQGRAEGFRNGVRYAVGGFGVQAGQNYIVDFVKGPRGFRVNGYAPMQLGIPYRCDALQSCTEGNEPIPITDDQNGDGCHDSYEDACIPPDLPDVECEDVPNPVTVVGPDEYGLDGGYGPASSRRTGSAAN